MEITQNTPATTWSVTHNLNTMQPAVDVWVDDNGVTTAILPKQIQLVDANSLNISFSVPIGGTAVVTTTSSQNLTHTQSSASAQWQIQHNFGSKYVHLEVMVQNNGVLESILPSNITSINDNQVNVYFNTPLTGLARVSK